MDGPIRKERQVSLTSPDQLTEQAHRIAVHAPRLGIYHVTGIDSYPHDFTQPRTGDGTRT
jgi:hypothetical protein